ncbi:MAG: spore maturation protein, partial [Firmicutes bacterium]|nr:spore maturation protein [Bacillota bacterium]
MSHVSAFIAALSRWVMPALMMGIPVYGFARGVAVYKAFVEGAQEGLEMGIKILPYLVGIMFATSLFRTSGAMDLVVAVLRPVLEAAGVPG